MHARGCWTCKDRKILCDKTYPECLKCVRSHIRCQGYGLRLSWPKPNNRKRAVFGDLNRSSRPVGPLRLVNASFWDVESHRRLASYAGSTGHSDIGRLSLAPYSLPMTVSWGPFSLKTSERTLLDYFKSVVSDTMATFDRDPVTLRGLLMRLAFSGDEAPSKAVLKALLALSSLHRHGPQQEADQLKLAALQGLGASFKEDMRGMEGIQHAAAGMLLCAFETQNISDSASTWFWYVCSTKHLINTIDLDRVMRESDFSMVLDWTYYHDVLCRFSLRHWDINKASPQVCSPRVCARNECGKLSGLAPDMLRILAELMETLMPPSHPLYHTHEYASKLRQLESTIRGIKPSTSAGAASTLAGSVVELYQLAALIYLERASGNFSGQSAKLDSYIDKAFEILSQEETRELPWPLLIFGCEARTDQRRLVILNLLNRLRSKASLRSFDGVHRMVQAFWLQDDLETERDVDYLTKLNLVIGADPILPVFA